jgi:hypothetical protein
MRACIFLALASRWFGRPRLTATGLIDEVERPDSWSKNMCMCCLKASSKQCVYTTGAISSGWISIVGRARLHRGERAGRRQPPDITSLTAQEFETWAMELRDRCSATAVSRATIFPASA